MIKSVVPRRGERLLEALGASTELRDLVIGDLREELALRVEWDGPDAARRWYYRECVRVAPYLIRDWWRELRLGDLAHMGKALGLASLATIVVDLLIHGALMLSVREAGSGARFPLLDIMFLLNFVWNLGLGVFGGYLAAWVGRRAPMPAAFATGATWSAVTVMRNLMIEAMTTSSVPLAIQVMNVGTIFVGTLIGGAVRVWGRDEKHEEPSSL